MQICVLASNLTGHLEPATGPKFFLCSIFLTDASKVRDRVATDAALLNTAKKFIVELHALFILECLLQAG